MPKRSPTNNHYLKYQTRGNTFKIHHSSDYFLYAYIYTLLFNTNIAMVIFILIVAIIAYEMFGFIGLFLLGFFYFFIKDAKKNYHENGTWIDDDWDD